MAASVMLLATTNQVCLDVAAVPFLWVLPLTLYLFSFILCFDSDQWYSRRLFMLALAVSTATVVIVKLKGAGGSIVTQVLVYLSGLFFCAMVCHGELARLRPHLRYLTLFYLIVAAGGSAGGVFVGIISPLIFPLYLELHIGLLGLLHFCGGCRRSRSWQRFARRKTEMGLGTCFARSSRIIDCFESACFRRVKSCGFRFKKLLRSVACAGIVPKRSTEVSLSDDARAEYPRIAVHLEREKIGTNRILRKRIGCWVAAGHLYR